MVEVFPAEVILVQLDNLRRNYPALYHRVECLLLIHQDATYNADVDIVPVFSESQSYVIAGSD